MVTAHTALPARTPSATLTCVICNMPTDAAHATAGSVRTDGSLAVACTAHLRERRVWFTAWCTFETTQRQQQEYATSTGTGARR